MAVANNHVAGVFVDPHFAFVGRLAVEYTNCHEFEDSTTDSITKKIYASIKKQLTQT